jgi:carbamoyltransferase
MRVLGISPFHDSSVAIVNDGKLESFYKEERYSRKKRDFMPWKSFLKAVENKKIDFVTISSPLHYDVWLPAIKIIVEKHLNCPVIMYCDKHHISHASLAFYNSGFEQSLVFVIDRNGTIVGNMREAESVFLASYPCEFKVLHKNYWVFNKGTDTDRNTIACSKDIDYSYTANSNMSIVKVYETATMLIGEHQLENGKTMGLAAYGKDKPFDSFFYNGVPLDHLFIHNNYIQDAESSVMYREYLGKETNNLSKENYQFYADYAFQVQKQTQHRALEFIKHWVDKTGIKNVCVTGGYGLNVVANEFYVKNLPDVNFYFEPLADDSGNSIGSAMHFYRSITLDKEIRPIQTTFIHGNHNTLIKVGNYCLVSDIAKMLSEQKTIAVFNGLAESGPRALGNRSILFDATNPNAKEIVNNIKKREWYRPFAAMVLEDNFSEYFDTNEVTRSEFMTMSFQVKSDKIPGVTHVDNSCRVQTVSNNIPHIYELLNEYKKITNVPVLLNTSFNLAGEPLVETQEQAISTFENSDLDVLWFPEISSCLVKG